MTVSTGLLGYLMIATAPPVLKPWCHWEHRDQPISTKDDHYSDHNEW